MLRADGGEHAQTHPCCVRPEALVSRLPKQVTCCSQGNLIVCLCYLCERKSQKVSIVVPSKMKKKKNNPKNRSPTVKI